MVNKRSFAPLWGLGFHNAYITPTPTYKHARTNNNTHEPHMCPILQLTPAAALTGEERKLEFGGKAGTHATDGGLLPLRPL